MGFPFEKLAPLPWRPFGNGTGVACADTVGSKVFATSDGHTFPGRGKAESIALAKAISERMNAHETLITALKEARDYFAERADADQPACDHPIGNAEMTLLVEIDAALKAGA